MMNIFLDELPDELPPMRDVNFEIKLQSDQPPPFRPVIRLGAEGAKRTEVTVARIAI